jgi:transcriptional regulator with XRE-family HTH domain
VTSATSRRRPPDEDGDFFRGLGPALAWLRRKRRMKQYEAAAAAGFTRGQLSAYEQERARPNLQSLGRLLVALGSDLGDLQVALRRARQQAGAGRGGEAPSELTADEITEAAWRLLGLLREHDGAQPFGRG